MLSLADVSIARSQRFSEAGQALALIRAGEQSAIVALRRDMIEAPDIDHAGEPWNDVAQASHRDRGRRIRAADRRRAGPVQPQHA